MSVPPRQDMGTIPATPRGVTTSIAVVIHKAPAHPIFSSIHQRTVKNVSAKERNITWFQNRRYLLVGVIGRNWLQFIRIVCVIVGVSSYICHGLHILEAPVSIAISSGWRIDGFRLATR